MRFSLALTSFAVLMTALGQPAGAVMPQKGEPSVSVPRMNMQDYPSTGPWLVEVESGQHENVIHAAQTKRSTDPKYRTKEAQDVPFKTHRTMTNLKGYNLVVVEGIHQEDLHKIQGVKAVNPNTIRTKAYAWGYDRIDQVNAPPDQAAWNADYEGCGVDVYVLDTGIDTNHREFQDTGNGRSVANIWNSYGTVGPDTDGDGHGTHCAGTVGGQTIGVARCANM
jgi:subtilisin family serine protease